MRSSQGFLDSVVPPLGGGLSNTYTTKGANMDAMPAKKKNSERRDTHLGIRVTHRERKRLAKVAKEYPGMAESALARIALMIGLEVIERDGIPARSRQ